MRFGREEVKRRSRTRSIAFFFFFLKAIGAFFFFVSFASVTQFHKCSSERHEPDALASRRRSAEVDSVALFFCKREKEGVRRRRRRVSERCRRRQQRRRRFFVLVLSSFNEPELLQVAAQRSAPGSGGHGAVRGRECGKKDKKRTGRKRALLPSLFLCRSIERV